MCVGVWEREWMEGEEWRECRQEQREEAVGGSR